jgi:L-alanine-DL-glutamate epimerase-like enolase superfamily enzyme
VRCDANSLWGKADDAVAYLRALDYGFLAVEEPLAPGDWEGRKGLPIHSACA